jgi:two-component system chemotaxis response regulator CheB
MSKLKVVVIDDSIIFRKFVRDALEGISGIEVVGIASDGLQGLEKVRRLQPDMVTLDVEMPNMDGITFLRHLKQEKIFTKVVMLSSITEAGAKVTLDALNEGAFDFIAKPNAQNLELNLSILKNALQVRVEAIRASLGNVSQASSSSLSKQETARVPVAAVAKPLIKSSLGKQPAAVVTIGISTGGPQALRTMIPMLPAKLSVPMLIVQHMPPVFTKSMAQSLDAVTQNKVQEAQHGEQVLAGHIYIAPGGKQMRIKKDVDRVFIEITDDPPENSCKPAVDYLFRSVLDCYGNRTLGVIMTGMGNDGTAASRMIVQGGGRLLAQDAASCTVYGMPRMITEEGIIEESVPLDKMAAAITSRIHS